jgi:DNA-binding transcriptional MerR regulator
VVVSQRSYLSIGDVLSLLREEFPDVTISKIRFLESQGLVDPERSPSGYRKFYEHDVARLRWVLRQQRDQFLPLRVIRDRLAAAGNGVPPDEEWPDGEVERPARTVAAPAGANRREGATVRPAPATAHDAHTAAGGTRRVSSSPAGSARTVAEAPGTSARSEKTGAEVQPPDLHETVNETSTQKSAPPRSRPADASLAEPRIEAEASDEATGEAGVERRPATRPDDPASHGRHAPGATGIAGGPDVLSPAMSGVSLTLAELCAASGLSGQAVTALESCGLIAPVALAGGAFYDEESLMVAKLAADFARFGIEPRHLRLYRNAADRELGLVEQVVTPLLRQRNPEARQRAVEAANELARLGQNLRASLVRTALRRQLGT